MGIYTAHDLPAVDLTIQRHMEVLTGLCRAALGANLESVVLAGSFGRGEGSVLICPDGSIQPLRDYDVRAILRHPVSPSTIESIRREFMCVTGLGTADERFSGETGFSITLEPLTVAQLVGSFVRDRDLRAYDHLMASKLLWGEDRSAGLRFPAEEIPRVNGLRFLYQKMLGLVGHFPGPDATVPVSNGAAGPLIYECDKTFIEICTALCLLAGAYAPSYRARAELFAENYRRWFPELAEELPDLDKQVLRATEEKLRPGSTAATPPREAFSAAGAALLSAHRYYVHRLYGVNVVPSVAGCKQLARLFAAGYYAEPVSNWLSPKKLDNPPARWALNEVYRRMLRLKYARGVGKTGLGAFGALRSSEAPAISIYLAAWCALSALVCRDGRVSGADTALLKRAGKMLDRLPGGSVGVRRGTVRAHDYAPGNLYGATRERIARAYHIWEHNR